MAAPNKVGLDYFSFDVDLLRDRKLRKPKMKYGYMANVADSAVLCMIYEDKGYYLDYTDKDDVIWRILEYLQGKYVPDYDTVAEVIACLVECELFSGYHFKQGTITSRRIQRMYYSATASRKTVDIEEDKWLLTMEEMKSLSAKHCYYLKKHNRANNRVNHTNNGVNRPNNLQSKVKESKVKNIVVEVNNTVTDKREPSQRNNADQSKQSKAEYLRAVRLLESVREHLSPVTRWNELWILLRSTGLIWFAVLSRRWGTAMLSVCGMPSGYWRIGGGTAGRKAAAAGAGSKSTGSSQIRP